MGSAYPRYAAYKAVQRARQQAKNPVLLRFSPDFWEKMTCTTSVYHTLYHDRRGRAEMYGISVSFTSGPPHVLCDDGTIIPFADSSGA